MTTGANAITVDLSRSSIPFSAAATTQNQNATVAALGQLPLAGPIPSAFLGLSLAAAGNALDALSGEIHPTIESALVEQSRYVRSAVLGHLNEAIVTGATGHRLQGWGEVYGGWGTTGSTTDTASTDRTIDGFIAGADARLGPDWRAGFAIGSSQSSFDADALTSSGSSDTLDLALYAGARFASGVALRAGGAYSRNDLSTHRDVSFPGYFDSVSASYDAGTSQAFAETSYAFDFTGADSSVLRLEPFAGAAFVNVATDAFQETGESAALAGASDDFSSTLSALGLKVSGFANVPGAILRTHAYFGWQHAFGDVDPAATLAFTGGASPFVITGAPLAPDSLLLGLGIDADVSDSLRFSAAYTGEIANATENAIKGAASWRF